MIDKLLPILYGLNAIPWIVLAASFLSLYIAYRRGVTRNALQALYDWAEFEHLELIDVQATKGPPWMLPDSMRAFEICVVDSAGRKRRGLAICGDHFRMSRKTVYVDWVSDPDIE